MLQSGGRSAFHWSVTRMFSINVFAVGLTETADEARENLRNAWAAAVEKHGLERCEACLLPETWWAYQKAHPLPAGQVW